MDKIDDLKAELKAMERIAKILHDLPSADSVVRVATWIQEVTRTDTWTKPDVEVREVVLPDPDPENPLSRGLEEVRGQMLDPAQPAREATTAQK